METLELNLEQGRTLNALDRCDSCGAQALGWAEWSSGLELLFCNHHLVKHEEKLKEQGARVVRVELED